MVKSKKIVLAILSVLLFSCTLAGVMLFGKTLPVSADELSGSYDGIMSYADFIYYNTGEVEEENDGINLYSDEGKLNLSELSYYYVNNGYGNKLYIADISDIYDEENAREQLVSVRLISKTSSYEFGDAKNTIDYQLKGVNNIEAIYYNAEDTKLVKVYACLSDEAFNVLILSAKDKDSLTDEYISEMLNKSLFFEVNFKSEISTMLEKEMNVQPMSSDSGMVELFNSYTQTDSFIYDYMDDYRGEQYYTYVGSYFPIGDDPIVNIIPKTLFLSLTTRTHIGLEYGFYIHTYRDYGSNNYSEVFVFDIEHSEYRSDDNIPKGGGGIKIVPLFRALYYYNISLGSVSQRDGSVDLSPYVPDLALCNISTSVSVWNKDGLNVGDENYKMENDLGYYVKMAGMTAKGVAKADLMGSNLNNIKKGLHLALTKLLLGAYTKNIPIVGTILKEAVELAYNLPELLQKEEVSELYTNNIIEDNIENDIEELDSIEDGIIIASAFEIVDQASICTIRDKYNNFPRAATLMFENQSLKENQSPLLYKTDSDYFDMYFNLSLPNSKTASWRSDVVHNITLDVVKDNTLSTGKLVLQDSADSACGYITQEMPESHQSEISENEWVEAVYYNGSSNKVYQEFFFTPEYTGPYIAGGVGDYKFEVFNSSGNKINEQMHYKNIANGINILNLTKGNKYTIRISSLQSGSTQDYGIGKFIIGRYAKEITVTDAVIRNAPIYSVKGGEEIWYYFSPDEGFYTLQTLNYDGSAARTEVTVYDEWFNRLTSDSGSGPESFSLLGFKFKESGYYICVRNIDSVNTAEFGLIASVQNKVRLYLNHYRNEYEGKNNQSQFYWFLVPENDTYRFYDDEMYGNNDTIITIYDGNMNVVGTADSGGGNKRAALEIRLRAGDVYIIEISVRSTRLVGGMFHVERL